MTAGNTLCLNADAAAIAQAAVILRAGGLVAFPTETVYGLGANALDQNAVNRIFIAKGRPAHNPIIVHLADATLATSVVADWPDVARSLAARFWPGPLTLVLPRRPEVPSAVTADGPTVAIRVPAHPVALALLRETGLPLAAPSANRSSQLSSTTAQHVVAAFDGGIDIVLDGGPCPGGIESTVMDITTMPPTLLRPGLITREQLAEIVGPVNLSSSSPTTLRSPGLLDRHYSPRTRLELADDDGASLVRSLHAAGVCVGWLTWSDVSTIADVSTLTLPREPNAFASGLYSALHQLDAMGLERIIVAAIPQSAEWLAIRDRLMRASVRK